MRVPQAGQDLAHGVESTLELEGKHPAEPAHLPRRHVVAGMRLQSGVVHAGNPLVAFEMPGDGHGALVLTLDAEVQGLHSAEQ